MAVPVAVPMVVPSQLASGPSLLDSRIHTPTFAQETHVVRRSNDLRDPLNVLIHSSEQSIDVCLCQRLLRKSVGLCSRVVDSFYSGLFISESLKRFDDLGI